MASPPSRSLKQVPVGTSHKRRKPSSPAPSNRQPFSQFSGDTSDRRALLLQEFENLPELVKARCPKMPSLHPFQLESMRAQLEGKDVLLQAPTGAGKTAVAAALHLLPSSEGMLTLMVSPLLALHREQVIDLFELISSFY